MRWSSRLDRLETQERDRMRRELDAMTDEELEEMVESAGDELPDLRAMSDAELRALIRYLERGGDPTAWRWGGSSV